MSYIEAADLADAKSFRVRVKMASVKAAGDILNESPGTMTLAQREKRLALAQLVLRDPEGTVGGFIYPVISNPAIASVGLAATDNDLDFQMGVVWDDVAGVTYADLQTA